MIDRSSYRRSVSNGHESLSFFQQYEYRLPMLTIFSRAFKNVESAFNIVEVFMVICEPIHIL